MKTFLCIAAVFAAKAMAFDSESFGTGGPKFAYTPLKSDNHPCKPENLKVKYNLSFANPNFVSSFSFRTKTVMFATNMEMLSACMDMKTLETPRRINLGLAVSQSVTHHANMANAFPQKSALARLDLKELIAANVSLSQDATRADALTRLSAAHVMMIASLLEDFVTGVSQFYSVICSFLIAI